VLQCDDFAPDSERASVELLYTVTQPPTIALDVPTRTAPNGTRIFVDSSFAGYENVDCLVDGALQTPGATTGGCSWASADTPADHWVCFVLPKPRTVSGLKLDWANWKDTYWTSDRFEIFTWNGDRWQRAARVQGNQAAPTTTHTFAPRPTDRVLLWQPSGGGHPEYQGVCWLTEVTLLP